MNLPDQYARALSALIEKNPAQGALYMRNLEGVLKRRGHGRLLPRVFAEYRKLTAQKERAQLRARVTPESERARTLLELYRTLISNNS